MNLILLISFICTVITALALWQASKTTSWEAQKLCLTIALITGRAAIIIPMIASALS